MMDCPICSGNLELLGEVPFDRNNSNMPIINSTLMAYYRCVECDFVCCPEMLSWSSQELGEKVYNNEYINFDPDYVETRPKNFATFLLNSINPVFVKNIRHLDYGSGSGILSKELVIKKWKSNSYDPYSSPERPVEKYNFITAFEVFEHSSNIDNTVKDIKEFLDRNGVVLFSTLLANKNTTIDWWYIGARNGHIGILSQKSMKIVASRNNLFFSSLSENIHILQSARSNARGLLGW